MDATEGFEPTTPGRQRTTCTATRTARIPQDLETPAVPMCTLPPDLYTRHVTVATDASSSQCTIPTATLRTQGLVVTAHAWRSREFSTTCPSTNNRPPSGSKRIDSL